ncbi:oxidoreductase [Marinilongibacter aquaticus]|uniref:WD40/YVTN/BNR-like repeat-containing protein n=1 Tax=Marinilongibacter aquaticus TaxID=2975157 RepID=UPI0021BD476A|nr:YCF48-related protein [Marinilongibacter aquaticus]UBM58331.1 oxidoreductase [Marinilongibacter aquaticus]
MNKTTKLLAILGFLISPTLLPAQWKIMKLDSDASFRSIDVYKKNNIWAGGSAGTVIHSSDKGKSWTVQTVGDQTLDFRGIAVLDGKTVVAVSAGLAEEGAAKVFRTTDAGKNWELVFETEERGVFLDGVHFTDKRHGFIIGDPLNGSPYVLETFDAGEHWARMYPTRFPKVEEGEASFAASNSNMESVGKKVWYAFQSRMLISEDEGESWRLVETRFPSGPTSGIFGLYFWNKNEGVLLGGDYKDDQAEQMNVGRTTDRGTNWQIASAEPHGLKESACRWRHYLVAVGPSGTSISYNLGKSWHASNEQKAFHAIDNAGKWCFAIGSKGTVGKAKVKKLLPPFY